MKIPPLVIIILLMIEVSGAAETVADRDEILKAMSFPSVEISFGRFINEPLFAINYTDRINISAVKEKIIAIRKNKDYDTDPESLFMLGNCYRDLMDYEKAGEAYGKYIELTGSGDNFNEHDAGKLYTKGDLYYSLAEIDQGNSRKDYLEKSLAYLKRSLEINPESEETWGRLGDCYLTLGMASESVYCYNRITEKNRNDLSLYPRLQAAYFHRDFIKAAVNENKERISLKDYHFEYLETAVNNSRAELKESLKMQQYIYMLRLIILNYHSEISNMQSAKLPGISGEENSIIRETASSFNKSGEKDGDKSIRKYLSGMMHLLSGDCPDAIQDHKALLNADNQLLKKMNDDMAVVFMKCGKDDNEKMKNIEELIRLDPSPDYYMLLAGMEFNRNNLQGAEMYCSQALKIDNGYIPALCGKGVIYAVNGNLIGAEEMIHRSNMAINRNIIGKKMYINVKVNEAAIALLKNEKERGYVLLRSVLSVDNNEKARQLYNRYFRKNE